jgi:hypothetical protein
MEAGKALTGIGRSAIFIVGTKNKVVDQTS